jgi:hypothetical protein
LFLLFGSTLVVKIKKTQESTPSVLILFTRVLILFKKNKENIILLLVDRPVLLKRLKLKCSWNAMAATMHKCISMRAAKAGA